MRISAGMLLFALVDSALAFFLVFYVARAKFGGDKKAIARIIGSVLGTLTFIIYFAVIVWFNTYTITASESVKMVVYLAPPVLVVLMLILIQLSKPPKKKDEEEENAEDQEGDGENPEEEETEEQGDESA